MDCWNSGIMGIEIENNGFCVFLLLTPSFHYSSWGKAPGFLYDHLTKTLFTKVRGLELQEIPLLKSDDIISEYLLNLPRHIVRRGHIELAGKRNHRLAATWDDDVEENPALPTFPQEDGL